MTRPWGAKAGSRHPGSHYRSTLRNNFSHHFAPKDLIYFASPPLPAVEECDPLATPVVNYWFFHC
jgi:hypothetical protein